MLDREEARKVIARVNERSVNPETLQDICGHLTEALKEITDTEHAVATAVAQADVVREQTANDRDYAAKSQAEASSRLQAAADSLEETSAATAALLSQAVTRLDALDTEKAEAEATLAREQERHEQEARDAASSYERLERERVRIEGSRALLHQKLQAISNMPWWIAMFKAAKTAQDE